MHVLTVKKAMFRLCILGLLLLAVPLFAQPFPPELSINDVEVTEGPNAAAIFTVSLNQASAQAVSGKFFTTDGSALANVDYTEFTLATKPFFRIPAGETSTTISVPITDDGVQEPTETFQVTLADVFGNAIIKKGTGTGTILDDDLPELSISDLTVSEADGSGSFVVSLSRASSMRLIAVVAIIDGSAINGVDFNTKSRQGSVFAPGQTSRLVNISLIDDTLIEGTETFSATLSVSSASVGKVTIKDGEGVGTILDDDAPLPELSINDVRVPENGGFAVFSVSLNSVSTRPVSVTYLTSNGTADANVDYVPSGGVATIPPNKSSTTISVKITDDSVTEPNETFTVLLSKPGGATLSKKSTGTGTIVDNEVRIFSVNRVEVPENGGFAEFTVSLSAISTIDASVSFATLDGTALSGGKSPDYTSTNVTAAIPEGRLSTTIRVPIIDDNLEEPNERFTVRLSNPIGGGFSRFGGSIGSGTILDNDKAKLPELSIDDVKVNEPGKFAIFTVSLSSASLRTVTVAFTTTNGTAIAGVDYKALRSGVRILPKTKSAKISVPIINDLKPEPTEDFFVKLSGASGAVLGKKSTGKGTIFDDDKAPPKLPEISINNVKVNENGKFAVFTVSLNSVSTNAVKVAFSTMDNTARAPGDYKKFASVATIPKGKLSTTISVPIVDDNVHEPTETFFVNLSKPFGAVLGKNNLGTATILDNDKKQSSSHDFLFLADKSIKRGRNITAGNIHSNGKIEFAKGNKGKVDHTGNVTAGSDIKLRSRNHIAGDVIAGRRLRLGSVTISGVAEDNAAVSDVRFSLQSFSANKDDRKVKKNRRLTLAPGIYGKVKLSKGARLELSHDGKSGVYFFDRLDINKGCTLEIDVSNGPVTLNVVSLFKFRSRSEMILLPGGKNNSEKVTVNYLGKKMTFGSSVKFSGTILAPNAQVSFSKNVSFRGAVCANQIISRSGCTFLHHNASINPQNVKPDDDKTGEPKLTLTFDDDQLLPVEFELGANYPNPFNPTTTIGFALPKDSEVKLTIYNIRGQLVRTLVSAPLNAGRHSRIWDGRDQRGAQVATGTYIYRIQAGDFVATKKLMLMK